MRSERDAGVSGSRARGKSHERSKRAHSEHRDRENGGCPPPGVLPA